MQPCNKCLFTGLPVGAAWNWTGTRLNGDPINKRNNTNNNNNNNNNTLSNWLSWPECHLCAEVPRTGQCGLSCSRIDGASSNPYWTHWRKHFVPESGCLLNCMSLDQIYHVFTHTQWCTYTHVHTFVALLACVFRTRTFVFYLCVHYHSPAWPAHHQQSPRAIHSGFNGDDANPWHRSALLDHSVHPTACLAISRHTGTNWVGRVWTNHSSVHWRCSGVGLSVLQQINQFWAHGCRLYQ